MTSEEISSRWFDKKHLKFNIEAWVYNKDKSILMTIEVLELDEVA